MLDFHSSDVTFAFKKTNSSTTGLDNETVSKRLNEDGLNTLTREKTYSRIRVFFSQLKSPLIYILLIAGVASIFIGEIVDAQVIFLAVLINVVIGYIQEDKANSALNKLKLMIDNKALVLRAGKELEISSTQIVVGDVLVLRPGRLVLADARLFEINNLELNEANLTGESSAVVKSLEVLDVNIGLADKKNMVYAGTGILSGNGLAVVVATGKKTEIGKISEMVKNVKNEKTPLQERLSGVSSFLGLTVLFICVLIVVSGVINGFSFIEIFSSAVAISIAAIPEGMAVAVTVILALGMKRGVKQKALTRKLLAAETLGSITVICSDKTGTLTEGVMSLEHIYSGSRQLDLSEMVNKKDLNSFYDFILSLKIGILCNNAVLSDDETQCFGSAIELSFLRVAKNLAISQSDLLLQEPRIAELPFNSAYKFMLSLHKDENIYNLYVKGAGEIVLKKCAKLMENGKVREMTAVDRERLLKEYDKLTSTGLRVIALAFRNFNKNPLNLEVDNKNWESINNDLTFVSLASFKDPLRKEAKETIRLCERAGIRPIIITGDHPNTAMAIASELKLGFKVGKVMSGVGLDKISDEELRIIVKDISVYARVTPEHKLRIISALKFNKEVVAMVGDGLNDSPALKMADIGVCLGSGTEVAKETADLVLLDNNFSVIVNAIKQGRIIFDNIRKSLTYLISDSFSEIILILGSILFHTPLALLPTQILWINIVNDGLPNFSLAFEEGDDEVMKRKPIKREEPIFNKEMKIIILGVGILRDILLFVLFYFLSKNLVQLSWSVEYLRTLFFTILIFKSLTSIFSLRSFNLPIHKIRQWRNKYLLLAIFSGLILMMLAIYLPFFNSLLKTTPLEASSWLLIILIGLINIVLLEAVKSRFYQNKQKD